MYMGRRPSVRALPSCHRNEQKEVGGWRRRQVGRREGEEAAVGGGELASAVLALLPS